VIIASLLNLAVAVAANRTMAAEEDGYAVYRRA
jgi:hypothetical protein